jgi:Limiting CO2-inducible proteins B/C beta carbonyic anhydrases
MSLPYVLTNFYISYSAMAHHIPDGGSCLVVYGPHVGVDSEGKVGQINRRGREGSGPCCGSAAVAAGYVAKVRSGDIDAAGPPIDALDATQNFVGAMLLPYAERLEAAIEPEVELPFALFDAQHEMMQAIVRKGCGEVAGDGMITLLGGIQINTPTGITDYFLPRVFEIRDNKGSLVKDLMWL